MMKRIFPFMLIGALMGALSCENESVSPKEPTTKDANVVAPPPRSIDVNARLEYCLAPGNTQVAYLYYRVNSGSWIFINSITTTGSGCPNVGTISASNGDLVEFVVIENTSGFGTTYRARVGAGCPNNTYTGYCGDFSYGPYWQHTVTSNTTTLSVEVSVSHTYPYCGNMVVCI